MPGDDHERVACESCERTYRWKPELAGRKVRCKCGQVMRMPEEPPEAEDPFAAAAADAESAETESTDSPHCPSCQAALPEEAVLCVECGYNRQTGRKSSTVSGAEPLDQAAAGAPKPALRKGAGRLGLAIVAGAVAAGLSGALWAAIVVWTGYEVGIVAWAVGLITGLSVMAFADEGNEYLGVTAAGLAVGGLLIGKALIIQWAVVYSESHTLVNDPIIVSQAVAWDTAVDEERPRVAGWLARTMSIVVLAQDDMEELMSRAEELAPPEHLREAIENVSTKSAQRMPNLEEEQKLSIMQSYLGAVVGYMSYGERIGLASSFYDLIWFFLAVTTAYKLGSGYSVERR